MAIVDRTERGNRIDQQQRRVASRVDGAAHRGDVGRHAGRGFVVDHADGLDLVVAVLGQARADGSGIHAMAPVAHDELGVQPSLSAIFFHSDAKWPVSYISTLSPGDSVLTSAASHAPVPDAG
jgi:hypothetical protein